MYVTNYAATYVSTPSLMPSPFLLLSTERGVCRFPVYYGTQRQMVDGRCRKTRPISVLDLSLHNANN